MKTLEDHVQNGRIVLDDLFGFVVQVLLPENDELTEAKRLELEAALEERAAQLARGELEDAFAKRLVATS